MWLSSQKVPLPSLVTTIALRFLFYFLPSFAKISFKQSLCSFFSWTRNCKWYIFRSFNISYRLKRKKGWRPRVPMVDKDRFTAKYMGNNGLFSINDTTVQGIHITWRWRFWMAPWKLFRGYMNIHTMSGAACLLSVTCCVGVGHLQRRDHLIISTKFCLWTWS